MDLKFLEYGSELYDRGFSPVIRFDISKTIDAMAEAAYLYPIEALATSIILGLTGSIFGGMFLAPISYIVASILTMAGLCKETEVFIGRLGQEYNKSASSPEDRTQKVLALKKLHFERKYNGELSQARELGIQLAARHFQGMTYEQIQQAKKVVARVQAMVKGGMVRRRLAVQRGGVGDFVRRRLSEQSTSPARRGGRPPLPPGPPPTSTRRTGKPLPSPPMGTAPPPPLPRRVPSVGRQQPPPGTVFYHPPVERWTYQPPPGTVQPQPPYQQDWPPPPLPARRWG